MKRNPKRFFLVALTIAMINLVMFFRAPDAASIRTVHVLQLLASGMLIGAAFAGLMRARRDM